MRFKRNEDGEVLGLKKPIVRRLAHGSGADGQSILVTTSRLFDTPNSDFHLSRPPSPAGPARGKPSDIGLCRYRARVYAYMACGLALTGAIAHLTADSSFHKAMSEMFLLTPFVWPLLVSPLGLIMLLAAGVEDMNFFAAEIIFWAYAAFIGFAVDCIVMVYVGANVAPGFFTAAITFAAMSVYAHIARIDVSDFGSLAMMGIVGLLLTGIADFYLAISATKFALSAIGAILFVALAAWDAERIEIIYRNGDGSRFTSKTAVAGALALYFDASLFPLVLQFNRNGRT